MENFFVNLKLVNGYQQYTDRESVRYNGQDYRYHTQHGNDSHDRSEYVRQDHTSNTWRNSGGRKTSVTPEMYSDPRDENRTYDSNTTQYMDRYAQHINVCQFPLVSNNQKAVISMCSLDVCGLHSKLKYNILQKKKNTMLYV